jgi:L-ascorbate metabolism protein UlaG (beta-lactamase superfamily)
MRYRSILIAFTLLLCLKFAATSQADPGKPVAIRWWGQGMVSIETYWNLHVVIDPYATNSGYSDPKLSADLVLVTHNHSDHNNPAMIGGEPVVAAGLDSAGNPQPIRHVLDRLPNAEEPTWRGVVETGKPTEPRSGHEIVVTSIPAWHDDRQGAERGANAIFLIEVDGLRIVHCGDLGQTRLTDEQRRAMGQVDVLLLPVGGVFTVDGRQAADLVRQVSPKIAVPIHYKTPALSINLQPVDAFLDAVKDNAEIVRPTGNTLAASAPRSTPAQPTSPAAGNASKTKVVVLNYLPWQMPAELAELLAAKEADSRGAQDVFAKLSANQMNFQPANGTHTPRWNAEHMMASELRFFTQIYTNRDPAVPMINLGPAQMPPAYRAAHPDWSGAEEARQMERVSALVRRFAYLLDGIGIEEPIPRSRQTLRRLFASLDGHYTQHTNNVKAKFSLPDWPKE